MRNVLQFLVALVALASIHVVLAEPAVSVQEPSPISALPLPLLSNVGVPFDALRGALVRFATTDATREALLAAISQPNTLVDEVCMAVSESDRESLIDQLSSMGEPASSAVDGNEVTVPIVVTLRSATAYLQQQIQNIAAAARKDAKVTLEPAQFASGLEDIAQAWKSDTDGLAKFFRELIADNGLIHKLILDLAKLIPGFDLLPKDGDNETDPEVRQDQEELVKGVEDAEETRTDVADVTNVKAVAVETDDNATELKTDAKETSTNVVDVTDVKPVAVETDDNATDMETDAKEDSTDVADVTNVTPVAVKTDNATALETDAEQTVPGVSSRRLQAVGTFIIPTEFLPEDFKNVMSGMGNRMFGVFSQLSEGMTSPVPSVLPFGNLLGDDKVVESDSLQGDLDGPVSLNNPMSIVTGPLELLGAPFELLGGSPPLETLMGLFDPAQLTIFDPSQIAALLPLGDAMSPLDLLSAFSFENLQSVFSPETISFLPSLIDAPNAEAVQQLLSPEALANAMDDESPFAAIIEKARESANDMEDSPGFLAPGGQFMLPLFGAVEAPIALFNLLGSDAFNDAINQLTVETSS